MRLELSTNLSFSGLSEGGRFLITYNRRKRPHNPKVIQSFYQGIAGKIPCRSTGRNDAVYEVIDGQQRTISICQYVQGDFSINGLAFHNLQNDKKEQILNYRLMVYFCEGTDSEKLEWFRTINIAGEKLTDQELRNAVYSGSWVSDAKRYFSKSSRPRIGDDYLSGSANRQEYLETALDWISGGNIE
ncbi:MAG: DUF262 domain-containing protein, partial [Dysgonamonadaceae bacterium]|nr:DUF262 domain-containing protein [Dysgonamonadaceae bacterium]